ncbi:MAG: peptidylprolyl isomerase [Marinilabiliales bacterium]|nr:MAG: peptidylprolyl isomerase [Marinilabiliales bacterium]
MRKSLLIYISALFLSFAVVAQPENGDNSGGKPEGETIDKVVAIIGDQMVLLSDVENQYWQLIMQGETKSMELRCSIFEELLLQKLLLAQAKADSIEVSQAEVDGELDRRIRFFVAQLGSPEALEAFYNKSILEIKDEFRELIYQQLLIQRMQGKITENVSITPKEVKKYFNSLSEDSVPLIPSYIEVGQIVIIPEPSEADRDAVYQEISALRDRILKGESFEVMARLYSDDPGSSSKGGELGLFGRDEMYPEFEAAAFGLKNPGDVSEIIETPAGYHILQLIERRGEYVNVRHILHIIKVSPTDMYQAKLKLDTVYNEINSGKLTFAEASEMYSDDPNKNEEGLMINSYSGNTKFSADEVDAAVFFVVDKLEPGSISRPVLYQTIEGKDGYRILYLKSRSEPHKANLQDDYNTIQELALNAKKMQALDKWVAVKKSSTYIRIMEDFQGCLFRYDWF